MLRVARIRAGKAQSAQTIVEAHEAGDQAAQQTLEAYTSLLGQLCGELTYQYMPMDGIYFAGSVARGVLRPEFHSNLAVGAGAVGKVGNLMEHVPKAIILDDAAALRGCLTALMK